MYYDDKLNPQLRNIKFQTGTDEKFSVGNAISEALQLFQAHPGTFILLTLIFIGSRIVWYYSNDILHLTVFPIFNVLFLTSSLVIVRDLDTMGSTGIKSLLQVLYQFLWTFAVWLFLWILISILPIGILIYYYFDLWQGLEEGVDISPTFVMYNMKFATTWGLAFLVYYIFMGFVPYLGLIIQLFNPKLNILKTIRYSFSIIFNNLLFILKFAILTILLQMTGISVLIVGFFLANILFLALLYYVYKNGIQFAKGNISPMHDKHTLDLGFN